MGVPGFPSDTRDCGRYLDGVAGIRWCSRFDLRPPHDARNLDSSHNLGGGSRRLSRCVGRRQVGSVMGHLGRSGGEELGSVCTAVRRDSLVVRRKADEPSESGLLSPSGDRFHWQGVVDVATHDRRTQPDYGDELRWSPLVPSAATQRRHVGSRQQLVADDRDGSRWHGRRSVGRLRKPKFGGPIRTALRNQRSTDV